MDDQAAVFAEVSGRRNEQLMDREPPTRRRPADHPRQRRDVELVFVDEEVLDKLVTVATTDAAPDEVTPPLGEGWTPDRLEWLRAFHRQRRRGFAEGNEETAAIRVDGRIVGAVRLHRSSPHALDVLEWGIWLAASWRGRGLSVAVLRLVVERAAAIGAARLVARTTSGNAPAIATLRRAGAVIRHGDDDSVHAEILLDGRSE
jgi:[ribosomal protein S5]-alanine N-acetyltransferase